jgi:hypothetical protein
MLLAMVLAGCSKNAEEVPAVEETLSGDLAWLQGRWTTGSSNDCPWCEVDIKGHFIRLAFMDKSAAPIYKRNVEIERLDEKKQLIIMYGRAWSYSIEDMLDRDVLNIEFYHELEKIWYTVSLSRVK